MCVAWKESTEKFNYNPNKFGKVPPLYVARPENAENRMVHVMKAYTGDKYVIFLQLNLTFRKSQFQRTDRHYTILTTHVGTVVFQLYVGGLVS